MVKFSKPFPTTVEHGTSELATNHFTVKALELNSAVLGKSPKAISRNEKTANSNPSNAKKTPTTPTSAKKSTATKSPPSTNPSVDMTTGTNTAPSKSKHLNYYLNF